MEEAAEDLDLPPGACFWPTDEEVIELYLLPRSRRQPTAIPGAVVEDGETSSSVPPWRLLARHGGDGDERGLYFFERQPERDGAGTEADDARRGRACGGHGTWVTQKRFPDKTLRTTSGKKVTWHKRALNLHPGGGRSGSSGWVMHEYTITAPPCLSPVKVCHVAFTGHGQKRQRVPDDDKGQEPPPRRKRSAAAEPEAPSFAASTTTFEDQEIVLQPQASHQGYYYEGSSVVQPFCESEVGSSQEPLAALGQPLPAASTTTFAYQEFGMKIYHNQEFFVHQSQAYNQLQFVNYEGSPSMDAYCALLAPSDAEPPPGQPFLTHEDLLLRRLMGDIDMAAFPCTTPANAEAACHDQHISTSTPAEPGAEQLPLPPPPPPPPPMNQESYAAERLRERQDKADSDAMWNEIRSMFGMETVQIYDDMAE